MSVVASDIRFRKSTVVTDIATNGGRVGYVEVLSGVKHGLFPRITKAERTVPDIFIYNGWHEFCRYM